MLNTSKRREARAEMLVRLANKIADLIVDHDNALLSGSANHLATAAHSLRRAAELTKENV